LLLAPGTAGSGGSGFIRSLPEFQRAGVLRRTEAGGARQPKCKPARHAGWMGGNTSDSGKMGLGRNGLTTLGAGAVGMSQSARGLSRWGNVGDLRQATFGTTTPPWAREPMASRNDDTAAGEGGSGSSRRRHRSRQRGQAALVAPTTGPEWPSALPLAPGTAGCGGNGIIRSIPDLQRAVQPGPGPPQHHSNKARPRAGTACWTDGKTSNSQKMGLRRNGPTTLEACTVGLSQSDGRRSRWANVGDLR
jgi:hypothetical protein